jgi:F-type H+-transporting ATPase subunit b
LSRDILKRLIPDLSTLWVVVLLLTTTVLLNSLIFKPILQVIDQRSRAVRDARELAESAAQKASAAMAEYHEKLQRARADVYRQMDEMRRSALDKRAALLTETRQTVETELSTATARVRQESETARATLDREAGELAGVIVARVLGRAP